MTVSVTYGGITIAAAKETALQLLYLREQIADSATWQALVALPDAHWNEIVTKVAAGDASRTDALAAVLIDRWTAAELNQDRGSEVPQILLRPFDESDVSWGNHDSWDVSGMFLLLLHLPIPTDFRDETADAIAAACVDFWNKADAILADILESGKMVPERVAHPRISRIVLPGEINPAENNGRRVRQAGYAISVRGTQS